VPCKFRAHIPDKFGNGGCVCACSPGVGVTGLEIDEIKESSVLYVRFMSLYAVLSSACYMMVTLDPRTLNRVSDLELIVLSSSHATSQ